MKIKSVKRALAATLAATMIMASAITAAASSGSAGSAGSSGSSGSVSEDSGSEGGSSESGSSEGGSSGSTDSFASTVQSYGANAQISVGGTLVRTTIAGAFAVKTVQGAAVVTPIAQVRASLGLKNSQTPYIIAFDTDVKKSHLAMNCVNAAAQALGGRVVATLNITLGAKENGKVITLSNGSAGMMVGLPKNADTSKTYAVACVQPGGVTTILEDQDDSPATVTFEIRAGLGTYGIIAR